MPLTMASTLPHTKSAACTRAKRAPAPTAAATPMAALPEACCAATAAKPLASSIPSSAMFTTPLRSLHTPPSAAHT